MKDPAFLFYSKDFYEGTRMMLPKERACYIDLLIYQHQNGTIPHDLKRVLMYCNGINLATLEATLEAKFERTAEGWENKRLNQEISARENYKSTQSNNGKAGQFWKKAKQILSKSEFLELQKLGLNKDEIVLFSEENEISKDTLAGLLMQTLSNNAIGNAIENEDGNKSESENEEGAEVEVLNHLNLLAEKKFEPVESNLRFIRARLKEKPTDFLKRVIELKVLEWKQDPKMNVYLRPETLFNPTKFQTYAEKVATLSANPEKLKTYAIQRINENNKQAAKHYDPLDAMPD